jgi:hypothetical protein
MPALKPCLDCGTLSDQARCPVHRGEQEAARNARRAPARAGRYDEEHKALRASWVERIAAGEVVYCRRGPACLLADRRVYGGQPWHLGHPDELCAAPLAPG